MNNTNKLAILAVALALTAVPAVQAAAAPNAGTFVVAGDVDVLYTINAMPGGIGAYAAVCFTDTNGDGAQQSDEPLYLVTAATCAAALRVAIGDIRLSPFGSFPAGAFVLGTDDDFDRTLIASTLVPHVVYFDADGNGAFNLGDIAYVHFQAGACASATACGNVALNDIALNGPDAFKRVTAAMTSFNRPLAALAGGVFAGTNAAVTGAILAAASTEFGFFNADGEAGFSTNDQVYFNALGQVVATPPGFPDVGDIRMTKLGTTYAAGTQVMGTDVDTNPTLANFISVAGTGALAPSICYVDVNGDAALSAGEAVYLQRLACGPNSVGVGDLRLVGSTGFTSGSLVSGSSDDFSRDTVALLGVGVVAAGATGDYCTFDQDGSGAYTAADLVWLKLSPGATCTLSINDVLLSGATGIVQVTSSTTGLNSVGVSLAAHAATGVAAGNTFTPEMFFNADGIAGAGGRQTSGDFVYLDVDNTGTLTINDVRLTAAGAKASGTKLAAGDIDLVYVVAAAAPAINAALCFNDANANAVLDTTEGLYAQAAGCGGIVAGNLRIAPVSPYLGGTLVKGTDDDFSRVTVASAAVLAFYDMNGNGIVNVGEPVYFNTAALPGVVSVGDIMVTSNKYDRVAAGDSMLNSPLTALAYTPVRFNADGVGAATQTTGDLVYQDSDVSGTVTVGDVRLTGLQSTVGQIGGVVGGTIGGSTGTTAPTTSAPTTSAPTTSAPTTSAPSTSAGSGTTSTPPQTPGFELVALVAALGAALVLVRRKL